MEVNMGSYADVYNNVNEYYAGVDQWERLNTMGLTTDNYYNTVANSGYYNVVKNNSGDVVAYTYTNTSSVNNPASSIDSNAQGDFVSTEIATTNTVGAGNVVQSTSRLSQGANFYFSTIRPAIAAAATGISCGKRIDSVLYNINPDFWDSHDMAGLDPDSWNYITDGDNTGVNYLFNAIFGLDPSKANQMYIDENAYAYLAKWLQEKNVFEANETSLNSEEFNTLPYHDYITMPINTFRGLRRVAESNYIDPNLTYYLDVNVSGGVAAYFQNGLGDTPIVVYASSTPFKAYNYTYTNESQSPGEPTEISYDTPSFELLGKPVYAGYTMPWQYATYVDVDNTCPILMTALQSIQYIMAYGVTSGEPSGFSDQPGATIPTIDPDWTINDTKNYLTNTYPTVFNNPVTINVVQPDGSEKEYRYVPVPYPTGGTEDQPTGGEQGQPNQQDPKTKDDTKDKDKQADESSKRSKDRPKGGDSDTGKGETPTNTDSPAMNANGLLTLYDVSQNALTALGRNLWDSSVIETIKRMFTNPMDAFISLKQSFILPASETDARIYLGYWDSQVAGKQVTNNIAFCNCGSVTLNEYFKNSFDYINTKIRIYLPFYGFANLDVDDVMRGVIDVRYIADLFTGETLIEVKVLRDGNSNLLYTFECNTSLDIPLSSGSYSAFISGALGIVGGGIGAIHGSLAEGGIEKIAEGIFSAGQNISQMHTDVYRGGKLSGNAGAGCVKTPFIIIERPQIATPDYYDVVLGMPALTMNHLSGASGFVRVKEIDLMTSATADEQKELESLLREGVYIS